MRELTLYKKTGFSIINPSMPVIILDNRNKPFYDNSELQNREFFNLPIGKYLVKSGDFTELSKPIDYPLNKVSSKMAFERSLKWPLDFKVIFANNPSKATIDWNRKVIIFDYKIRELTLPEIWFIYYHELAHARYKNEMMVDRLAENMMLLKGFNPSQTALAPVMALSAKQEKRKIDSLQRNIHRNEK